MPIPYLKPPLAVAGQVALLQSRGMVVTDVAAASKYLERLSYYRFTGYALPWRQANTDQFRTGANFDEILALYEFDRRLRDLIWCAIEPIEIALRTRMTLRLTITHQDAFAHNNAALFRPGFDHARWLQQVDSEAVRSHELFIQHYRTNYDGFPRLPMWMATEVMSFGVLSRMYDNLRAPEQASVARNLGLFERFFASWMHTISVARNACAHHSRCWDRRWAIKPLLPKEREWDEFRQTHVIDRIGVIIFIINRLLIAIDYPSRLDWQQQMRSHVTPMVARWGTRMGLPKNFDVHPLWN
jgi:abortive infection bacteriophage resistance protein